MQQPEPIVGGPPGNEPMSISESLEGQGVRGQSIYTVLFDHVDMGRFTCKICRHIVNDELEDAITHQRVAHFHHYPYRCSQTQWYVLFFFPMDPYEEPISIQCVALRKPSRPGRTPACYWALIQDGSHFYDLKWLAVKSCDCYRLVLSPLWSVQEQGSMISLLPWCLLVECTSTMLCIGLKFPSFHFPGLVP